MCYHQRGCSISDIPKDELRKASNVEGNLLASAFSNSLSVTHRFRLIVPRRRRSRQSFWLGTAGCWELRKLIRKGEKVSSPLSHRHRISIGSALIVIETTVDPVAPGSASRAASGGDSNDLQHFLISLSVTDPTALRPEHHVYRELAGGENEGEDERAG